MPDKMRPVVIYGGSFDPPHRGHMALAAAALRQLRPAALYFVPGFRTPFKDLRPVPFAGRAALLRAALAGAGLGGRKEIKISSFEADLKRVVYTWETVAHFRRLHPGAPLFILMGSDCLAGFGNWRRPGFILKHAGLLAGLRPGFAIHRTAGAPFTALAGRFPRADSTGIRAELFLGGRPAQLHREVLKRIEKKGLYLGRERALLKKLLSKKRYAHSLHTAELALRLAPAAGAPQQKAALAALLHDCARDLPRAGRERLFLKRATRSALPALTLKEAPVLAHAWAGAAVAAEKFGVRDPEVLQAIELHSTGAPGMGPLARLIYLCDLANEGREHPGAGLVRKLAFKDLGEAFRAANYVKLVHAFSGGGWVHPLSVALWNSLREKKKG
ncbi:MAG: bis(5'-nucleosyl)-tetraphosphatase (symmetrical) YqeK [Elusimicrobia bacterium]|nr:bis(5'-nucleosyl)-tetraphosphatase (symmetrical) YqeK [Elusimicrobiota bacterium]